MRMAKVFHSDGSWYFQLNMSDPVGPFRCFIEAEAELRFAVGDLPKAIDPRDPDPNRKPPFDHHYCARCGNGAKPCVEGNPQGCSWLHARND